MVTTATKEAVLQPAQAQEQDLALEEGDLAPATQSMLIATPWAVTEHGVST